MADILEDETYDTGVYQLETTDPVQGGVDGVDNLPHKALANRTRWLKKEVEAKANLEGSSTQIFKAKPGVASGDVVNKAQLDAKANLAGSSTQIFKAKPGVASGDVVNKGQLDAVKNAKAPDSDKLDGLDSSSFVQKNENNVFTDGKTQYLRNVPNSLISSSSDPRGSLEIAQPTPQADAYMTFHIHGDYACHFGLDGSTNALSVGGWSMGNVSHKIWHEGNMNLAGTVILCASNFVPAGYVRCNGANISRTVYHKLFSALGTMYGAGNGSTTFKLPDLRGEFVRGWDEGRGVDSGRGIGSWQDATGIDDHIYQTVHLFHDNADNTYTVSTHNSSSGYAGTNRTHKRFKVRPRNRAMLYCIKY